MIDAMSALSPLLTPRPSALTGRPSAGAPAASFGQTLGTFLDSQADAADPAASTPTADARHASAADGNDMPSGLPSDSADGTAQNQWAAALIAPPPPPPSTASAATDSVGIQPHAVDASVQRAIPGALPASGFATPTDAIAADGGEAPSPPDLREPPRASAAGSALLGAAGIDVPSRALPSTAPVTPSHTDAAQADRADAPSPAAGDAPAMSALAVARFPSTPVLTTLSASAIAAPRAVAITPPQARTTPDSDTLSARSDAALGQLGLITSQPAGRSATTHAPVVAPPVAPAFDATAALDAARPRAFAPPVGAAPNAPPAAATPAAAAPPASLPNDATAASIVASAAPQPAGRVFAAALATAWRDRTQRSRDPDAAASAGLLAGAAPNPPGDPAIAPASASPTALDLARDSGLERMIAHIETLRDDADARDTRIRLVPDSLGGVDVAVRQEGDRVHVHFTVEQEATRSLLADAQPRLTELAAARGLRIGDSSVSTESGGGNGATPQPRPAPPVIPAPRAPVEESQTPSDARVA